MPITRDSRPPFRADHIGSLPRPELCGAGCRAQYHGSRQGVAGVEYQAIAAPQHVPDAIEARLPAFSA